MKPREAYLAICVLGMVLSIVAVIVLAVDARRDALHPFYDKQHLQRSRQQ